MKGGHGARLVARCGLAFAALACAYLAFSSGVARSQIPSSTDSWTARIRENLTYHVIRLARWPDSAFSERSQRISIVVVGRRDDGMARLLQARGHFLDANPARRPHGRGYVVRTQELSTDSVELEALRAAHVVYVPEHSEVALGPILRATRGVPVLVVGESKSFALAGGMVGLVLQEGRIRPYIGLQAIEAARLQVSAELLRHAELVRATAGKP